MQCLGRTRQSNFLQRCKRPPGLCFFCGPHVWQPVAAAAALVTLAAGLAEFSGYKLRELWEPPSPIAQPKRDFLTNPFSGKVPQKRIPICDFEVRDYLTKSRIPHTDEDRRDAKQPSLLIVADRISLPRVDMEPVRSKRLESGALRTRRHDVAIIANDLVLEGYSQIAVDPWGDGKFATKDYEDWYGSILVIAAQKLIVRDKAQLMIALNRANNRHIYLLFGEVVVEGKRVNLAVEGQQIGLKEILSGIMKFDETDLKDGEIWDWLEGALGKEAASIRSWTREAKYPDDRPVNRIVTRTTYGAALNGRVILRAQEESKFKNAIRVDSIKNKRVQELGITLVVGAEYREMLKKVRADMLAVHSLFMLERISFQLDRLLLTNQSREESVLFNDAERLCGQLNELPPAFHSRLTDVVSRINGHRRN